MPIGNKTTYPMVSRTGAKVSVLNPSTGALPRKMNPTTIVNTPKEIITMFCKVKKVCFNLYSLSNYETKYNIPKYEYKGQNKKS